LFVFLNLGRQTDYDFVDYVNQLREDIFEAYTSTIQGLRTDGKGEPFLLLFASMGC
jgi:hypothetical protein